MTGRFTGIFVTIDNSCFQIDSFPMPICTFRRTNFAKIFKEEISVGYWATKSMKYYSLKGHLLIDLSSIIDRSIAPTYIDEREI